MLQQNDGTFKLLEPQQVRDLLAEYAEKGVPDDIYALHFGTASELVDRKKLFERLEYLEAAVAVLTVALDRVASTKGSPIDLESAIQLKKLLDQHDKREGKKA